MDEIVGLEFEKPVLELESKIAEIKSLSASQSLSVSLTEEVKSLEEKRNQIMQDIFSKVFCPKTFFETSSSSVPSGRAFIIFSGVTGPIAGRLSNSA